MVQRPTPSGGLRELETQLAEAETQADVATLDAIATEDFTLVGPAGFVLGKSQWLDRYRQGALVTIPVPQSIADGALTPAAQKLSYESKSSFQLPSNVNTPVSPLSPKPAEIKLIDYNFAKYGSAAERKRLLERWDREVGGAAK